MTHYDVYLIIVAFITFLITFIGALKKFVADPINNLEKTLVETNSNLKIVELDNERQNVTIGKNELAINELTKTTNDHELRLTIVENGRYAKGEY